MQRFYSALHVLTWTLNNEKLKIYTSFFLQSSVFVCVCALIILLFNSGFLIWKQVVTGSSVFVGRWATFTRSDWFGTSVKMFVTSRRDGLLCRRWTEFECVYDCKPVRRLRFIASSEYYQTGSQHPIWWAGALLLAIKLSISMTYGKIVDIDKFKILPELSVRINYTFYSGMASLCELISVCSVERNRTDGREEKHFKEIYLTR